jgi:hypothetical protein
LIIAVEAPGFVFGSKPGEITADHLGSDFAHISIADIVDPSVETVLVVLQHAGAWTFCSLGVYVSNQGFRNRQA